MSVLTAPACSVFAASLLRKKTLELKSKIGNGHGTPVDAHDVMMAKYLHDSISILFVAHLGHVESRKEIRKTHHPITIVTKPNPPAILNMCIVCSKPASEGLYPN